LSGRIGALELASAFSIAALILFAAGWSVFVALRFERPVWGTGPYTAFFAWFMGQALIATGLVAAAGLVLGLIAAATLRVLS